MRISDWSSDVCSSDLGGTDQDVERAVRGDDVFDQAAAGVEIGDVAGGEMDVEAGRFPAERLNAFVAVAQVDGDDGARSEERRVGKECVSTCRCRWSPEH